MAIALAVVCVAIWRRRSYVVRTVCAVLLFLWFLNLLGGMYWTMRGVPRPDQEKMKSQAEYGVAWQDGASKTSKRFTDIWPPIICVYATGFLILAVIPSGRKSQNEESQPPAAV